MGYFPFFMDIAGKNGIIVGGGKIAARKVEKLLGFKPKLTVIAPRIEECIREQEKLLTEDELPSLFLKEREFCMSDLAGADFVIAATDDEILNGHISDYCMAEHIPVNVVDDREKCSFFFPALVREGNLTIGISTDGNSPVAAAWVRKEIARMLPGQLGKVIDLMGQLRPRAAKPDVPETVRKEVMEKVFAYCMEKGGDVTAEEAERYLESMIMAQQPL